MEKDVCIRCGKETPYSIQTPITSRLYFVEGAGQLCAECWRKIYRMEEDITDMKCLRCQGSDLIKANRIEMSRNYNDHISHFTADVFICSSCGHVELILPQDQIEKQKRFISEEENR